MKRKRSKIMPVEEDTFYDVKGYEVSRTNLVQQMVQYYEEKLEIGETRVSDFNEGSEVRNLLEAIAVDIYNMMEDQNELAKIAFVETAEGEWLDKHGANPFIQLARDEGTEATGFVTFSIPEVMTSDVLIPEGTIIVSTDNSLDYVTESDLIIGVGETSITGSAICLTVGEDGNCPEDTITLIEDDLGVNGITVTNEEPFTNGTDYEEDEEYRERLLAFVRQDDFGSISYYHRICEEVDGVHDVNFIDASGYTKKCLVNGSSKPTSDTVLADVLEVLTISDNVVLGHNFTVAKPDYVVKDLTLNLTVSEEVEEELINNILTSIFDGVGLEGEISYDGLSIGEALTKESLYNALLLVDEVEEVVVLVDGSEMTDFVVDEDEALQLGTVEINQTLVE
jgi:hypothetical protein